MRWLKAKCSSKMEENKVKKSKLVVILVSCMAVLAVVLFICSFFILRRASEKEEQARQMTMEALNETRGEEKEKETVQPQETQADAAAVQDSVIAFEDTDDNVFIIQEANIRTEPSTDSDIIETAPKSKLFKRTGISTDWSRLEYNGQTCYVSNDLISTEMPADAVNGELLENGTGDAQVTEQSAGRVVVIDPGHQGQGDSGQEPIGPGASETKPRVSSGTSGTVSGLDEYELNLIVSQQLRDELQSRGYTVYMTRESHDVSMSNKERADYAAAQGGDIFVRIHANGSEDSSVSGALTMAPSDSNPFLSADLIEQSQALSQCVIDSYVAATGFNNQGVYMTDDMSGINWCTMPVTIVEMGYMSNPSDDASMADPTMQVRMVDGIANGIDKYFASRGN
ncbi:MAG: N-acetylmuramoyl-L-alanine amidase [Ruminococcus sp.]|jgi:N-acetylmuramoyl-L-alanine amidase